MMDGFEPPARLKTERVPLKSDLEILVLHVEGRTDTAPFTFEGWAYKRVESTTRQMPRKNTSVCCSTVRTASGAERTRRLSTGVFQSTPPHKGRPHLR